MDSVADIKGRLPIEELVRQYTQLTKKGRNYVGLCPFHHDTHPSFLVSPDKGICYCFPCQKGGDIFSFYQAIEGVDFPQALKELAERVGVVLPDRPQQAVKKDEKERIRETLERTLAFFVAKLAEQPPVMAYLASRGVTAEEAAAWELGFAPDSFSATYDFLLKSGCSRSELSAAGVAINKDLDDRMFDRFRGRLMFPIRDVQGRLIGFGGRSLAGTAGVKPADNDAKYLNSPDGPLYHKSAVLYGLDRAAKAIRDSRRVILVEGYFDVLACVRAGVANVVATCGTALTEEHVRTLKRLTDTVVLCLDQDDAGRAAADRAFVLASAAGIQVEGIVLADKDPADAAVFALGELTQTLTRRSMPYFDIVLRQIGALNLQEPSVRVEAMRRVLPLIQSIASATERSYALRNAAGALATSETAFARDLQDYTKQSQRQKQPPPPQAGVQLSALEIVIGLAFTYPRHAVLLSLLIEPDDSFAKSVVGYVKGVDGKVHPSIAEIPLPEAVIQKIALLALYCEQCGMGEWNEAVAAREIRGNCQLANKELIRRRQTELGRKLLQARASGEQEKLPLLENEYQELLKLARMAG